MFIMAELHKSCLRRRASRLAVCLALNLSTLVMAGGAHALADVVTAQITVDQFGWLPRSAKVAVFAEPVLGQNAGVAYHPGPSFEVRRQADSAVVFRGKLKAWNEGKVSDLAGDRVWHADFSSLRAPGTYHLYDSANRLGSFPFRIGDDVYRPLLRDSVRTFFYQRSGTPITAKYGGKWHHGGGHLGPAQDRAARYTQGGKAQGSPRDLLGGWFDAGDLNKYVPYLETTLFDLLWAYELNPRVFGDDTEHPRERQRRSGPARRGEVGAGLAAEDAGHRWRGLQSRRRAELRQRPRSSRLRHAAAVLHGQDHLGDRDRRC